jgi:hypothetical protein
VGYYDEYAISDLLHNIIAEGDFSEFSYPNSIFATSKRATEITLNNYQIVDNYVAGWGSRNGQTEGEFFIYRIDPESNLVDAATVPNPPRSYLGVFYEFGQTFLVWENYLFAVVVDQIMVINMDVAVDRPDDAEFRDFTDFYIGG